MSNSKNKPIRKKVIGPFAQNLATVLRERELSQRNAADIAEVPVSVINDWLAGSQPYNLFAVQKLCHTLGIDFEWILTGQKAKGKDLSLEYSDIFEVIESSNFSGLFEISARRLKFKEGKS